MRSIREIACIVALLAFLYNWEIRHNLIDTVGFGILFIGNALPSNGRK